MGEVEPYRSVDGELDEVDHERELEQDAEDRRAEHAPAAVDPTLAAVGAARQSWRARLALVEANLALVHRGFTVTTTAPTVADARAALDRALGEVRAMLDDPTDVR